MIELISANIIQNVIFPSIIHRTLKQKLRQPGEYHCHVINIKHLE